MFGPNFFPCRVTNIAVPITGMKFSCKYIRYLIIALGVNFWKGLAASFPRRAIESPALLDFTVRSFATSEVSPRATRVPSKVSIRDSSIRRALARTMVNVLDSLRTSKMVVKAAIGPCVKTSMASCGRYVNVNIAIVTPRPRDIVGISLERSGFQRLRCVKK